MRAEADDRLRIIAQHPRAVTGPVLMSAWSGASETASWDVCPPDEADLIVVPWVPNAPTGDPDAVAPAMYAMLAALPDYPRQANRYVLLDNSDLDPWAPLPRGHLFKTSIGARSPNAYPLPYNVPYPGAVVPVEKAIYDIGFQGALGTHPIREAMNLWRYGWAGFKTDIRPVEPFWTLTPDLQANLRRGFAEQMAACRLILCPRGRGLNSRRFYETLAHGRIPVLYSDAAVLPLERRLPWDRIAVRVPEGFGKWTDRYVRLFLDRNDLATSCALAREIWLEYLQPRRLRRLIVATLADAGVLPREVASATAT